MDVTSLKNYLHTYFIPKLREINLYEVNFTNKEVLLPSFKENKIVFTSLEINQKPGKRENI